MNASGIIRALRKGEFWSTFVRRFWFSGRRYRFLAPFWKAARVVPNKVVCSSYKGRFHADSPAAIADRLLEARPDLDVVWLLDGEMPGKCPRGIRTVPYRSLRALWELATARIWLDNMRKDYFVPKKKGQFYVQTWHGSFPLKMLERDAADTLPADYRAAAAEDTACCDLMLSGCRFFTGLCRTAFGFGGEVLECGTPRMDGLFRRDAAEEHGVRKRLGLEPDDFVVLYAPTFRREADDRPYIFDFAEIRGTFRKLTGKRTKVLAKLHPNVEPLFRNWKWEEDVIDAMHVPDIQPLYKIADCLLTDYSGTMFEFALLGKPVFLFMNDYEHYIQDRKLYFAPEELPFAVARTMPELLANILASSGEADWRRGKVEAFFGKIGLCETGEATRLAAERILREIPPIPDIVSRRVFPGGVLARRPR